MKSHSSVWVYFHHLWVYFDYLVGEISWIAEYEILSPCYARIALRATSLFVFFSSFSWFKNHLYLEETKTSSISIHVYLDTRLSQCTSISRGAGHSVGACEGSKTSWLDIYLIEHWTFYGSIQNNPLSLILELSDWTLSWSVFCSKILILLQNMLIFNEFCLFNSQYA